MRLAGQAEEVFLPHENLKMTFYSFHPVGPQELYRHPRPSNTMFIVFSSIPNEKPLELLSRFSRFSVLTPFQVVSLIMPIGISVTGISVFHIV